MTRTPIWWTIRAFATLVAFWVFLVPHGLAQTPAPEKRLAALPRSQFAQPVHREAADTGFRFLRDRMWDSEHGGFFWDVDPTRTKVLRAQLRRIWSRASNASPSPV